MYETSSKVLALVFTVALAVVWRSYWALYGQVAATVIRVVISISITSEKPQADLESLARTLVVFSMEPRKRGSHVHRENGDRIILARFVGAGAVGAYTMGREIADMPMSEVAMPANRALGPGLAALQDNPRHLVITYQEPRCCSHSRISHRDRPGYLCGASHTSFLGQRLGGGYPGPAVPGALERDYCPARSHGKHPRGDRVHQELGNRDVVRGLLLIAVGIPGAIIAGAVGMAVAFLVSETLTTGVTLFFYRTHLPAFSFRRLGHAMIRPGSSALIMVACVIALNQSVVASDATLTQYLKWSWAPSCTGRRSISSGDDPGTRMVSNGWCSSDWV